MEFHKMNVPKENTSELSNNIKKTHLKSGFF